MTDGRSDRPESDELGIRITPVDDEFAERATDISPSHRVEPRGTVRGPIITDPSLVNREPPRRLTPRITTTEIAEHALSADRRSVPRLYFEALIGALALWLFVSTFIVQPVAVPTGSMLNTILIGDHLLVNRVVFGSPSWMFPLMPYSTIHRGDVIVFRHPNDPTTLYVKRVIGLPGETLEIYGARVYIDGKELPENRALVTDVASDDRLELASDVRSADGARYTVYFSDLRDLGDSADDEYAGLVSADRGTFGVGKPFTIPSGQYFCMGDNRDNSEDSRFWGTVPRDNIVGRAVGVYWSSANGGSSALGLPKGIRWSRIGTLIQ